MAGLMATAQTEKIDPAAKARAISGSREVVRARMVTIAAVAAISASSTLRRPKRRIRKAAGIVPMMLPMVALAPTTPRKSSR